MSDPLGGAAQEWYKKGSEAMGRQNWDFAVECFSNAVKMKPDVVLFRQTKHGCCRKHYGDNGTGAKMAGMKLMGIRGKIKKARGKQEWTEMDQHAEDGLSINPWDAQLFADLGEACAGADRGEIAAYAYRKAVELDKTNIVFNRGLGHILHERGEYKDARNCFKRIYEADPTDGDARSMMGRIDADSVMDRGGYEKAGSTQDVKADKTPTNAYEEDRRARGGGKGKNESVAPGESEEMDMRAAIRKDPENINHYMKLANFLRADRQLPQAMEQLDKALELSKNDASILEEKEDVELEIMRERSGEAAERSRKNPDKERLKEKSDTLKAELVTREVEVLASRIDRHPNDMKMRMELADRYRKTKQYAKAIPLFQQASADTRLKEDSLVLLGECFVRAGKADLGRRQFMKALETLNAKDKPEFFKQAHYWLGRLYEKASKNEEAENHYTEILSVDYDFRDVLKRLEEIQGGDEFGDIVDDDED
ncbi:MAG: tetratricopeptide repeat protein [Fuerstiella sp.]|nr:tetratricopeptide repeat protein [Fuerstiella sp.]MCP4858956.1 tetratricopeptide repeat protein [Fuerstiella sp.]